MKPAAKKATPKIRRRQQSRSPQPRKLLQRRRQQSRSPQPRKRGGVRLFFNRGGGRVLGLIRKGLMIWLMVVKIVGLALFALKKAGAPIFNFRVGGVGTF